MILLLQVILIVVLFLILAALYIDEKQKKSSRGPKGKLTEFWNGSERRVFTRVGCEIPIKYSLSLKEPAPLKIANAKDVSIGGVCISITEKLNINDSLAVEINCPGSPHPIIAIGKVAWINESSNRNDPMCVRCFDAGLEFRNISPNDREKLLKFIKESSRVKSG